MQHLIRNSRKVEGYAASVYWCASRRKVSLSQNDDEILDHGTRSEYLEPGHRDGFREF